MPNPKTLDAQDLKLETAMPEIKEVTAKPLDNPLALRAIIWDPSKDPGSYRLPKGALDIRPFSMPYLDRARMDITPPDKNGDVAPSFKTFALNPGINWVTCQDWADAIEAGKGYGTPYEMPKVGSTVAQRLEAATHHSVDPLETQIEARAIIALKPRSGVVLTGTINDYDLASIKIAVGITEDTGLLTKWQSDIQSNSSAPHPQKENIVTLIARRLTELSSGISR